MNKQDKEIKHAYSIIIAQPFYGTQESGAAKKEDNAKAATKKEGCIFTVYRPFSRDLYGHWGFGHTLAVSNSVRQQYALSDGGYADHDAAPSLG
ncbi:hypothetical protein J41TS4_38490 [Paenibacillus apis]|uniref:Uncharacterized protein n=1 Tax=Paenibacillus apis TaxID=1792174 RepID=A0A919Y388_9BACL|nr:hypothetical protein [Paenibacillus apis]GIO44091.1 hypothetical protein J41TS4_38490 [Paenibacillus apis]